MGLEQATKTIQSAGGILPSLPWSAKISMEFRQSRYIIKTAQSSEEFAQVIQLRSEVFLREFAGKSDLGELDLEDRDYEADFLIIKDALTHEVLASYRLISSMHSTNYYSQTEFDISNFLSMPAPKLELSRACVRADRRQIGIFVHLLWRGLSEYIALSGCRYLFGCSSVKCLELSRLVQIYKHLQNNNYWSEIYDIKPLPQYRIIDGSGIIALNQKHADLDCDDALPPLLLSYLKAGAKVFGTPAYDQDFGCLDLFTVLDFVELSALHARKYPGRRDLSEAS